MLELINRFIDIDKSREISLEQIEELILDKWQNIDLLEDDYWQALIEQIEMISMVTNIHARESSSNVLAILKSTTNVSQALNGLEETGRARNIYMLPKDSCKGEIIMVGDLHNDFWSLIKILRRVDFINKASKGIDIKMIFLGDYIDRGKLSFALIDLVLTLKILYPKNIFLLRGNHDGAYVDFGGEVNIPSRIGQNESKLDYFFHLLREIEEHNPKIPSSIIQYYQSFFDSLAIVAFFDNGKIFMACHGGIPRPYLWKEDWYGHLSCIFDLTNSNIKDLLGRSIVQQILWSDPCEGSEVNFASGRFSFNEEHFKEFCKVFGVDTLVRGHEAIIEGIRPSFDGKLYTVFSSGSNPLSGDNPSSAYTGVSPQILSISGVGVTKIRF